MKRTKINRYKILRGLHIYASLFSMMYLLIVGLSSLNFQHKFLPEQPVDTVSYSRTIHFDSSLEIDTLSKFIRDELGISGYLPKWEFRENKKGLVRFTIERPVLTYEVKFDRNNTRIEINEVHYSLGRILRALHFGSMKHFLGYTVLKVWSWYGQLSALSAFVAIVTGIWFWFKYAVKSRRQWIAITLFGLSFTIFIVYIWVVG